MQRSHILFMLHAHLPFVRHPEYPSFLEENWLFEAISETYLPLLRVMDRLEGEGVPFKISMSISPTLCSMLTDELLQERYITHLEQLLELAEKELTRTKGDDDFHPLAEMYRELYKSNYEDFTEKYERNILRGFDYYYKRGRIELLTTAATHAFLPLYELYPETVNAQIEVAADLHTELFGKAPKGFWLPECGYYPGLEKLLERHGFRYFFAASHGVLFADKRPAAGVYRPVQCRNGVSAFGRDLYSANAVWSASEGYPADYSYRDFYRDIGYDLPMDYIAPYIHSDGIRIPTGFKYHAITGDTDKKQPYRPERAQQTVEDHAENFVYTQKQLQDRIGPLLDSDPVVACPYDAELFGHWWFEGPQWIEAVMRKLADEDTLELATPSEYLKETGELQTVSPSFSSWGNKGYSEVWLEGANDWIYRHLHKAIERMIELAERFPDESGLKERALNQAAREVLLSQASDWPFIMHARTNVTYAERRIRQHIYNFTSIYDSLSGGAVSTEWLTTLERRHNLFPDLNYRVFSPSHSAPSRIGKFLARR